MQDKKLINLTEKWTYIAVSLLLLVTIGIAAGCGRAEEDDKYGRPTGETRFSYHDFSRDAAAVTESETELITVSETTTTTKPVTTTKKRTTTRPTETQPTTETPATEPSTTQPPETEPTATESVVSEPDTIL